MSLLGDYKARKGVITKIDNKILNLKGEYLITSSVHAIDSTKEKVTLELIEKN